jgi:hypothetical protein
MVGATNATPLPPIVRFITGDNMDGGAAVT